MRFALPRLTALLATISAASALAVASSAQATTVVPEPVRIQAAGTPGPLHVDDTRLRDAAGRDVVLRGIAVINKKPPFYPDVDASDFRRIRDLGLNHIRLGISWAGVMPREGEVDRDYLAAVDDIVAEAQRAGLWVVVDMHQDLYGGSHGNGAPDWAVRPAGCPHVELAEPTGAWSANYLSPEVSCAFTNFWLARDLQAHYRDAWRAVAAKVGGRSNVIGYDLMNEPWPGYLPPVLFERFWLYPRQTQWLRAIRTVDPDAVGFVEPSVLKTLSLVSPPPAGMLPENSVYSPHLYGLWDATSELEILERTRELADVSFAASRRDAEGAGVPLWIGEWGVFTSAGGAAEFATHVYDLTDEARAGNAIWEYGDAAYGPYDPRDVGTDAAVRRSAAAVPGGCPRHVERDLIRHADPHTGRTLGERLAGNDPPARAEGPLPRRRRGDRTRAVAMGRHDQRPHREGLRQRTPPAQPRTLSAVSHTRTVVRRVRA